ncbi:MAG: type VI secretion system baseplate subunit TssF [Candidatus Eisenbacteria bacterium]
MPAARSAVRPPRTFASTARPSWNLFLHESDPLRMEHDKVSIACVLPAVHRSTTIYLIDRERDPGRPAQEREPPPFPGFSHDTLAREKVQYYTARVRESVVDERADTFLSFVDEEASGLTLGGRDHRGQAALRTGPALGRSASAWGYPRSDR